MKETLDEGVIDAKEETLEMGKASFEASDPANVFIEASFSKKESNPVNGKSAATDEDDDDEEETEDDLILGDEDEMEGDEEEFEVELEEDGDPGSGVVSEDDLVIDTDDEEDEEDDL